MAKSVYIFGDGIADGDATMRNLLGGKGANLAEMSRIGLPVPPGLTITTDICARFYANSEKLPEPVKDEVLSALRVLAERTGRIFGDGTNPLLLSVRSGARASMPGMMDTILNLGLNQSSVEVLARLSGDARFAYDSYRRFLQMYGNVVLEIEHARFEEALDRYRHEHGHGSDADMAAEDWKTIVATFLELIERETGTPFPQDPHEQLWNAIGAVFRSWMSERAITYRRLNGIPESWGTAVNVQAMVFGNMGDGSATGVVFTRNPSTGEKALFGEYLENAQGEDVVAGIRTPRHISTASRKAAGAAELSMQETMADAFAELERVAGLLERHFADMQDIEFTVERGKLWLLQTRAGKRSARAAIRIAVELEREGLIDKAGALMRVDPESLAQLLHPMLDPAAPRNVIGRGLPASPGAAAGEIVFTAADAERLRSEGRDAVLVRQETSPEDIGGMNAATGILTARGGMTSHAAVVARGMGKPCICGVDALKIDLAAETLSIGSAVLKRGDRITIDGSTGDVMAGNVETIDPEMSPEFRVLMEWADGRRRMRVRANAETRRDAEIARDLGAEGIGLARTEHMFFEPERIVAIRRMILATDEASREAALAALLPEQRRDFIDLFEIMRGRPVTIRLLDPPLHEFLPHGSREIAELAHSLGLPVASVEARVQSLSEVNPMLGFRGCRLGVAYPEITRMQARAILEAAAEVERTTGTAPAPEIMVPLVISGDEFKDIKKIVDDVAADMAATGLNVTYSVGTMIELPRAVLKADEIAETAEFFSFGTNDLTQTCFGLSRDDAGPFLEHYLRKGLIERDPFASLDVGGVGELMEIGIGRGRKVNPELKIGICGEHGGDPASIFYCEKVGLSYVSCSPYRVPIARLAAAQATISRLS